MKPTEEQYGVYQYLFDYLNEELFEGELPACMLTFTDKGKRSDGYFNSQSWVREGEIVHEISLNPEYVKGHSLKETMALLAHQMVHLWQHERGRPSRNGYHNREWASKMRGIGLIATNTGEASGAETGQKMGQYVEEGGRFEAVYERLAGKKEIPFQAMYENGGGRVNGGEREQYRCRGCGAKVWGRAGLKVVCGDCGEVFEGAEGGEAEGIRKRLYELLRADYGG